MIRNTASTIQGCLKGLRSGTRIDSAMPTISSRIAAPSIYGGLCLKLSSSIDVICGVDFDPGNTLPTGGRRSDRTGAEVR